MTVKVLIASSNHGRYGRYQTQLPVQEFLIIQARDGLQCLEGLRRFRPHVLILDEGLLWGGAEGVLARLAEEGPQSSYQCRAASPNVRGNRLRTGRNWLAHPAGLAGRSPRASMLSDL